MHQSIKKTLDFSAYRQALLAIALLGICCLPHPGWAQTVTDISASDLTENHSEQSPQAAPYRAHLAFAGGGWRAHTGHAAWTLSLLKQHKTLDQTFTNVGAISSNSGGSWFNTMLSYSSTFVAAMEAENALQTWATSGADATGWIGQQQYLFAQAPCKSLSGALLLVCVSEHYTGSLSNAVYWHKLVADLVFHDNKVEQALNSPRRPWADDKTLLLASSMLTNNVVLGQKGIDKQYYQVCLPPLTPALKGHAGAYCQDANGAKVTTPDVTPVTFTSLPSNTNLVAPPFFSATTFNPTQRFNVGYTENAWFFPPKNQTTIGNPETTDSVPVMVAAAASSAAAGFAASESVTGVWEASYLGSDEALNFQLKEGLKHALSNGKNLSTLSTNKAIQIADGGAVDNSAVAQLVSFLQQNDQDQNFNIVAFDNVTEVYQPGGNAADLGVDFANLFGKGLWQGDKICSGSKGSGHCVTVPNLQIFDAAALSNTPVTWSAAADTNKPPKVWNKIIYTQYQVTTIDNVDLGIKAGSTGTLHAFTAAWTEADTAPASHDFQAYGDMLKFIAHGLQRQGANGTTGLEHLEAALGLK